MENFLNRRCTVTIHGGAAYSGILRKMLHHPAAYMLEEENTGLQVQFLASAVISIY